MLKIRVKLLALALLITGVAMGQSSYKQSIGLRLGSGYYDVAAVAYKAFISKAGALELDLGIRPYGVGAYHWTNASLSGAYQHHFDIKPVDGLKWFVGGGVVASNTFSNYSYRKGFNLGVFPTAGADYKFKAVPLAVSADVRPTFHVVEAYSYYNSFYPNVGISARYTF